MVPGRVCPAHTLCAGSSKARTLQDLSAFPPTFRIAGYDRVCECVEAHHLDRGCVQLVQRTDWLLTAACHVIDIHCGAVEITDGQLAGSITLLQRHSVCKGCQQEWYAFHISHTVQKVQQPGRDDSWTLDPHTPLVLWESAAHRHADPSACTLPQVLPSQLQPTRVYI